MVHCAEVGGMWKESSTSSRDTGPARPQENSIETRRLPVPPLRTLVAHGKPLDGQSSGSMRPWSTILSMVGGGNQPPWPWPAAGCSAVRCSRKLEAPAKTRERECDVAAGLPAQSMPRGNCNRVIQKPPAK